MSSVQQKESLIIFAVLPSEYQNILEQQLHSEENNAHVYVVITWRSSYYFQPDLS